MAIIELCRVNTGLYSFHCCFRKRAQAISQFFGQVRNYLMTITIFAIVEKNIMTIVLKNSLHQQINHENLFVLKTKDRRLTQEDIVEFAYAQHTKTIFILLSHREKQHQQFSRF